VVRTSDNHDDNERILNKQKRKNKLSYRRNSFNDGEKRIKLESKGRNSTKKQYYEDDYDE
jgi:hypothetical protein